MSTYTVVSIIGIYENSPVWLSACPGAALSCTINDDRKYRGKKEEEEEEEAQGASLIRMRLISFVELIMFPESSQTSGHAHRSHGFQSKSIKEKSLYWNNRKLGFMAQYQR